jgi:hypothetical protein
MRPTNRRFTTNNPNPSAGAAADDAEKTSAMKSPTEGPGAVGYKSTTRK